MKLNNFFKISLTLSTILLSSSLISSMGKKEEEKENKEFILFEKLPDDIKGEIIQFAGGLKPGELADLKNLEAKTSQEIQDMLNKLSGLFLVTTVNKQFKKLIDNLYAKDKQNIGRVKELILDKKRTEQLKKLTLFDDILKKAIKSGEIDVVKKLLTAKKWSEEKK